MQKITTLEDLNVFLNEELKVPSIILDQQKIDQFGKVTGDVNDHNSVSTTKFIAPAVQGLLSLDLFGGFHKQVCLIKGTDPTIAEVINAKFLQPIYVGQRIIPVLKITFVQDQGERIKVIWEYELRSEDAQVLLKAQLKLLYFLAA